MHIPQGFFISQKNVSKHHGTRSVSPMPVTIANYLWQWEHQKLGWIGLAKIPKLGTLENSANTWKHSCIVELSATVSKCKKGCIKMFTWKTNVSLILFYFNMCKRQVYSSTLYKISHCMKQI